MSAVREVNVRHEGLTDYTDALQLMKDLQKLRIDDEIPDTLLIMEHPEIVTVGPVSYTHLTLPTTD